MPNDVLFVGHSLVGHTMPRMLDALLTNAQVREQVINGLRGVGVNVVAIGEGTCGKPVGFLPRSDECGTTYSIVNFESVNARNEGRYFDGFLPTCAVAEDFTRPLGSAAEPLLAAARTLADGGACPVGATREQPLSLRKATPGSEPGERQGMVAR